MPPFVATQAPVIPADERLFHHGRTAARWRRASGDDALSGDAAPTAACAWWGRGVVAVADAPLRARRHRTARLGPGKACRRVPGCSGRGGVGIDPAGRVSRRHTTRPLVVSQRMRGGYCGARRELSRAPAPGTGASPCLAGPTAPDCRTPTLQQISLTGRSAHAQGLATRPNAPARRWQR